MKRIFSLLFFFSLFAVSKGQPVRKISIQELESYIAASNKPLVLNFWATYCKPCLEEMPYFLESAKQFPGIELVLVSMDLPESYPAKLSAFLERKPLQPATHLWLNETDADYFCPRVDAGWQGSLPVSLFVNPKKNYRVFVNRAMQVAEIKSSFLALDATAN